MTPTVGLDFDGVLHAYTRGWHDGTVYDPPVPGALESLELLMGPCAVFVFTTRAPGQAAEWLTARGVPAEVDPPESTRVFWHRTDRVLVTNRKLAAAVYVDDRAVRFTDWGQTMADLEALGIT